ncbi:hypothetical protein [Parvularcula sp. LCG005]|uniref:hypothetical protein n=1 Tax=Parvularcula sp. LCG005 TaxID=3078805 RepID=UPI0029432611|nr:hypothetical protein [Parvularcula sp. LCG005]WOI52216.1 hypothetical protein RUI03_08625 [Parvularcula sp. LCG005]
MARLVYSCRFEVAAADGLEDVLATYKDWIVGHYRERRELPDFDFAPEVAGAPEELPKGHSLVSSVFEDSGERAVRMRWAYPDDTDVGLKWANEIRVGQFGDRCGVEHLISIESVEYSVAPAKLLFGSPRAVRDICTKASAYIGQMQVRAEPYALKQDGLDDLLALLTSDLRKLPVVLLSPYARGELNQIDSVKLARNLAGVAVVVRVEDPGLTWDFADEVGRQLSCFNGAVRIYWPGFSKTSDPRSHRLFFGSWIEQVGPQAAARTIERAIFAVAAFRYVPDERISGLIRHVEAAERQKVLDQQRESGDEFWEDYQQTVDKLRETEERLAGLEAENANLRANQQVFFEAGAEGPGELAQSDESEDLSFSSVVEAVTAAALRCKNLEILESATSAASASPFQRPYDIFNALRDLDEIVDDWSKNRREKGSGGDLLQHLRGRGWGKRSSMHISDTTRGKFRFDYEFEYEGEKQLFEPHITIGAGDPNSCASIHFIFDQKRLKMVIGHVGRHLPNTNT